MIGHEEEEQEDIKYKVADKRKFNPDGSVREGVKLDAEPREPVKPPPAEKGQAAEETVEKPIGESGGEPDIPDTDDELPGAKDPASFVNFLSTLATNAAAALGAIPHPATGQRSLDLESGKYWLDTLSMLREKTKGNLHPKESKLLESLLGDLKMQYVHLMKATEEKLKERAAAKFSGDDILGKK